jgi:hypothetical protein
MSVNGIADAANNHLGALTSPDTFSHDIRKRVHNNHKMTIVRRKRQQTIYLLFNSEEYCRSWFMEN